LSHVGDDPLDSNERERERESEWVSFYRVSHYWSEGYGDYTCIRWTEVKHYRCTTVQDTGINLLQREGKMLSKKHQSQFLKKIKVSSTNLHNVK
jgi:hypothetical protein